jgi:type II secretory pathway pseudopilin PulG
MMTPMPIRTVSKPRRRRAGLTILEMLVSTAMLSLIVVGLTAALIQVQKAFKTAIKQNTITDAGRSIVEMISGDLRQMSDAQNTNFFNLKVFNMWWGTPNLSNVVNYENGVAIRTNRLEDIFILVHTNTTWVGVGYAVSNYPGIAVGTLYRYETNWTYLPPVFTNNLWSAFNNSLASQNFNSNYWHRVADGVIDLEIRPYDQYGNTNYYNPGNPNVSYYPVGYNNFWSNTLPNSVELEFGILEPEALVQARGLAGNPAALRNFLSTNSAPKMEIFRQRITVAAASR